MAEKKEPAKKAQPAKKTVAPAKSTANTAKKTTETTKKPAEPAKKPATTAKKPAEPAKKATPTKPATTTAKKVVEPAKPAKSTATTAKKPVEPAKPTTTAKKPAEPTKPVATEKKPVEPAKKTATTTASGSFADRKKKDDEVSATMVADTTPKFGNRSKTPNTSNSKSSGRSSGGAKAATMSLDRNKIIIISVAAVLILVLILSLAIGLKSCKKSGEETPGHFNYDESNFESSFSNYNNENSINKYSNNTVVGYSGEYLGEVPRQTPAVSDGGLVANGTIPRYPKWGSTLNLTAEQKTALINESSWTLCAVTTTIGSDGKPKNTYNRMDKDGNLYLNENPVTEGQLSGKGMQVPTKLYKHTAAGSMYGGGLSDAEPALIKNVTLRPRGYSSYSVTGLYAPAGEVIKIEMSGADMNATGGITVHIGQALYNTKANNIWVQRGINRMPTILNTMVVTKATATYNEETDTWTGYVGSFLGGPIYVRNTSATVNVKITGGVRYSHFILGYTSEEEFAQNAKSTAPYFDLEVWNYGVLHSGPKSYSKRFSYDDLYKAAVLWEKISLLATSSSKQGIVFLYDCFVAAGAAVAFPGQMSVNCPAGWMTGSLNYSAFVSGGSWGNMHEYHHNFQNYGLGSGADGEVTNNGLNLVSYSLFTKISQARGISGYGGAGLSGWNSYTSATWALNRVNTGAITSTNGLAIYATLLHNFGQDQYLRARGSRGVNNYLNKWATNTHYDMTYFARKVSSYGGGTYTPSTAVANANYPLFVPVSSVYQTGRTYMFNDVEREINTMQPYVIPYGKDFTVDLRPYENVLNSEGNNSGQYKQGSIIIGGMNNKLVAQDFTFTITNVDDSKADGTLTPTDVEGVYTFKPGSSDRSGKIYVTLKLEAINDAYKSYKLDDVKLILEFQQSRESTKSTLERTTYKYSADGGYTDAEVAFNSNFAGCTNEKEVAEPYNHVNFTQNANTDIWMAPAVNASGAAQNVSGKKDFQIMRLTDNNVDVIDGKLLFNEDGKYRVYLRGRLNCALYYSIDGNHYDVGATIKDTSGTPSNTNYKNTEFRLDDPNSYFDIQFETSIDGKTRKVTVFKNGEDRLLTNEFTGDRWLYIKEVLISKPLLTANGKGISVTPYIGIGTAQWTEQMYTTQMYYYDQDGNPIDDPEKDEDKIDSSKTEMKFFKLVDGKEVEVSETEVNNATLELNVKKSADVTYANAFRRDYEIQKQFTSDYFYTRSYNYGFDNTMTCNNKISEVVSCNYEGDSGYALPRITDGNTGTGFHSTLVKDKPFELVVNLNQVVTANHVTFYGFTGNNNSADNRGTPKTFTLYVSKDGVNFEEIVSRNNMAVSSVNNTFDFDMKEFQYYKLVVEATASKGSRIALNEIQFYCHSLTLDTSKNFYSPDNEIFYYTGNWRIQSAISNFGHVYIGDVGAELEFKFDGTYLGIISSKKYGSDFDVYIDNMLVTSVTLKKDESDYSFSYMSQKLSNETHTVLIRCKGQTSIDSIVVYNK